MSQIAPLLKKSLVIGLLLGLVGTAVLPIAWADESDEKETLEETTPTEISFSSTAVRNAYLLLRLKQYIVRAETNYSSLQEKMDETRAQIDENRYTLDTLEAEVIHLEDLSDLAAEKIYNVQEQIAEKEHDIQDAMESIAFTEVQIEDQKRLLEEYFRLLYFEKVSNYDLNNEANTLKILLQDGTVSTVLQDGTYISMIEGETENLLEELHDLERVERMQNYDLSSKRHQLASLQTQLETEYENLTAQLESKQALLEQTQTSDEIYRDLYASYKVAQEAILDEINMFETNIDLLDDRIRAMATEEDLEAIELIESEADLNWDWNVASDFVMMDWPVSPKQGLTAFFDDSGYASQFGVAHHALDIRVNAGTIIYAPADAVVYKVVDTAALEDEEARLGYGYIILAHRMGVMTLYGHISGALVQEGDFVHRGEMIGLTGGIPGMPGSGVRTTGAHLHMEVIQDGIRVDPLEYLPLDEVPLDSLPEEYHAMYEEQISIEIEDELYGAAEEEIVEEAVAEDEDPVEAAHETIESNTSIFEEFGDEEFSEDDFWTQGEL